MLSWLKLLPNDGLNYDLIHNSFAREVEALVCAGVRHFYLLTATIP